MVTFRTAIPDIYPGWLRKIPKPGWLGREGKSGREIRVKKNAAYYITPFSGKRRGSAGLLPVPGFVIERLC